MSEPYVHRLRPGSGNRESGPTFHFYGGVSIYGFFLQGNAQGDLFGSQSTAPAAATSPAAGNEGVRDRGPSSNTGLSTAASQSGNPSQSTSDDISLPSIVKDGFGAGMPGSDRGAQSSTRSSNQRPEVNYTGCSSGLALVRTTPIEELNTVSELTIPPITQPSTGMPGSDLDIQSNHSGERSQQTSYTECKTCKDCGECQASTVADTSGDPTVDEHTIPPPKGLINKVEHFFRALKKTKRSSLRRLLNLGRQAGPPRGR